MKSIIVAAGIAVAAIGSAQTAPFQMPTNSGVRIGFSYAIDSGLKNVSNSLYGLGLDLPISFTLTKEAESVISFDWIAANSGGATIIPILFNQRFYNKTEPGQQRSYFFVGLGGAIVNVNSSNLVLAGRAGFGTEFSQNLYGEASILYSDASAGAHATSLGFYLGYHF